MLHFQRFKAMSNEKSQSGEFFTAQTSQSDHGDQHEQTSSDDRNTNLNDESFGFFEKRTVSNFLSPTLERNMLNYIMKRDLSEHN